MIIEPYSDDYMTYEDGVYTLTAKAVFDEYGIDLQTSAKDNARGGLAILKRISRLVYKRIHEYNSSNCFQDEVIAKTDGGRKIIYEAMLDHFLYVKMVGDLTMSTDPTKRSLWFSETAQETIERVIPEIGSSLCYTGVLRWRA